jgi:peptidoglycan-associated lipoprotein
MRGRLGSLYVIVPTIVLALFLTGCPKRPGVTQVAAPPPPAPAPAPAPGRPLPPAAAPAPAPTPAPTPAPPPGAAPVPRPAPATPRAPKEYSLNPNLKAIHFDFDKSDIRPGDAKILDGNAAYLKANPSQIILIEGHCDERGTNEYNLALGERRARTTLNYLVAQGVPANRITTVSYGEERPLCTEKTETCWAENRRATFLSTAR